MTLAVAVKLEISGGGCVDFPEYPADLSALDDMVLNEVPQNTLYSLFVDGAPLQERHLQDCVAKRAILRVQVVFKEVGDAAQQRGPPKVVIKLVDARPVLKHEMFHCPDDVDELDDAVLNHLVMDGRHFTMTVDGSPLTQERLRQHKSQGCKLIVHVRRQGPEVPAASTTVRSATAAARIQPARQAELARALQQFSGILGDSNREVHRGGNVLVNMIKCDQDFCKYIQLDIAELRAQDPELCREAEELLQLMKTVFDEGLTSALACRSTIGRMADVAKNIARAFSVGSREGVSLGFFQLKTYSEKLATASANMTHRLAFVGAALVTKREEYDKKRDLYRLRRDVSGAAGVACGAGSVATGGVSYMVGLVTAEVAAVSGLWGTSLGAVAAVPAAWNPVGLSFLLACGVCLVACAVTSGVARQYHQAGRAAQQMSGIAAQAHAASGITAGLWNGLVKWIDIAKSNFEDSEIASEDQEMFCKIMAEGAESLSHLQRALDEYLVFLDDRRIFPVNFSVQALMGQKRFAEIHAGLQADGSIE